MPLKNTAHSYGAIAKWLHWITAALFLAAYIAVYYRQWFTEQRTPQNLVALHWHLSAGISIGVLVILRITWRLMNRAPDPVPGTGMEHRAAHAGHLTLYAVMILAPLTGYVGTGVGADYFHLFEIPKFEDTWLFETVVAGWLGMTFEEFEEPMDFIHKRILGEWVVWLLILGHVLAAVYHQYVRKDGTMDRIRVRGERSPGDLA